MSKIITLTRTHQSNNCTLGTLVIEGSPFSAVTLERPGPDTIVSGQRLRVPEGDYQIQWHNGPKFYYPVINLFNSKVPASRAILMHVGNYPSDTDGCILVGTVVWGETIGKSVAKLTEFNKILHDMDLKTLTLRIVNKF